MIVSFANLFSIALILLYCFKDRCRDAFRNKKPPIQIDTATKCIQSIEIAKDERYGKVLL